MEHLPYSQLERGTFLVAAPEMELGLFFRSVVLVCEHTTSGSFGLIINKKLQLELPEEILNSSALSNPRVGIQAGGPLQTNQMMLLHTSSEIADQTLKVCDGVYLGGDLHFLQESVNGTEGPLMRLCFGYVAWGNGQLEREFLDGNWFLAPGSAKYVFSEHQERIWSDVLKDLGGKYASLAMIPEDLSLN